LDYSRAIRFQLLQNGRGIVNAAESSQNLISDHELDLVPTQVCECERWLDFHKEI